MVCRLLVALKSGYNDKSSALLLTIVEKQVLPHNASSNFFCVNFSSKNLW